MTNEKAANLSAAMDRLEAEAQRLRAQVEELEHKLKHGEGRYADALREIALIRAQRDVWREAHSDAVAAMTGNR